MENSTHRVLFSERGGRDSNSCEHAGNSAIDAQSETSTERDTRSVVAPSARSHVAEDDSRRLDGEVTNPLDVRGVVESALVEALDAAMKARRWNRVVELAGALAARHGGTPGATAWMCVVRMAQALAGGRGDRTNRVLTALGRHER